MADENALVGSTLAASQKRKYGDDAYARKKRK